MDEMKMVEQMTTDRSVSPCQFVRNWSAAPPEGAFSCLLIGAPLL